LQAAGLKLLERNYRTPGRGGGEIDLVMRDPDGTLVFVEVRSRASNALRRCGCQHGAIKQRRIVFAARHYLLRLCAPPPCRFDVVLVQPTGAMAPRLPSTQADPRPTGDLNTTLVTPLGRGFRHGGYHRAHA
jgi:Holliday junction resolvase-like predicted endonuclease